MEPASISALAHAVPGSARQTELWTGFFAEHYANNPLARRIFTSSGVDTRHAVVSPLSEDISGASTGERMRRYLTESLPLGKEAVAAALDAAGIAAADVGLFAVASCTGYVTPGLDIRLAQHLAMSDQVQRLMIGHMGCYAALPGLGAVTDFCTARGRPAVLLCLELPSLHLQPPTSDIDQVVAHALFSDAAAVAVVEPGAGKAGWQLIDVLAQTDIDTADLMTWDITDLGFRMGLSPRVPDVLARHVRAVVTDLLDRHGLRVEDVAHWAVHPGGPRILDVVSDRLDLDPTRLQASADVLREVGNCSSATVLLVMERIARDHRAAPGDYVVALAFGPGLTLYTVLLRAGARPLMAG